MRFPLPPRVLAATPIHAAERPNILFVIADDWSHGHAGAYGCRWIKTPAFDRVAREGVLFANCFTNNPKCSPCRASILTGRNTLATRGGDVPQRPLPRQVAGLPGPARRRPATTSGFTGKGWGPGDSVGGFKRNPAGPAYQRTRTRKPLQGSRHRLRAQLRGLPRRSKPGQPFCFWVGGHEPHRAYEEGSGLRAGRKPGEVTLPAYYPTRTPSAATCSTTPWRSNGSTRTSAGSSSTLEEAGELDNTIVVVTSDHGMPFPRVKGQIYEHGFHIPLAIRWGRNISPAAWWTTSSTSATSPRRSSKPPACPARHGDGQELPGRAESVGFRSGGQGPQPDGGRQGAARCRPAQRRGLPGAGHPHAGIPVRRSTTSRPAGRRATRRRAIRTWTARRRRTLILDSFDKYYKLCFGRRPAAELYRIDRDPDCVNDLASDPANEKVMAGLRAEMEASLKKDGDPECSARGRCSRRTRTWEPGSIRMRRGRRTSEGCGCAKVLWHFWGRWVTRGPSLPFGRMPMIATAIPVVTDFQRLVAEQALASAREVESTAGAAPGERVLDRCGGLPLSARARLPPHRPPRDGPAHRRRGGEKRGPRTCDRGRRLRHKGTAPRTAVTAPGPVTLKRVYFTCFACGSGRHPAAPTRNRRPPRRPSRPIGLLGRRATLVRRRRDALEGTLWPACRRRAYPPNLPRRGGWHCGVAGGSTDSGRDLDSADRVSSRRRQGERPHRPAI